MKISSVDTGSKMKCIFSLWSRVLILGVYNSVRCAGTSSGAEKEVGLKANRMTSFLGLLVGTLHMKINILVSTW